MNSLTFGELKQALACCTIYKSCEGCPLYRGPDLGPEENCTYQLLSASFNCIRMLEEDLARSIENSKYGGNS